MGYYTCYSLDVIGVLSDEEFDTIHDVIASTDWMGYGLASGGHSMSNLETLGYGFGVPEASKHLRRYPCNSAMKWYDWRADMLELSRRFPEPLFKLHGEGEEPGDLWECYFHAGKSQLCIAQIVYPPYDPAKME